MKIVLSVVLTMIALTTRAAQVSYLCSLDQNKSKTALVAGNYFKMSFDDDLGINNNFEGLEINIKSGYLGSCAGISHENNFPLAQGSIISSEISGEACAADGFDLFLSGNMGNRNQALIQVNSGPEEVFYNCHKIH